MSSEEDDFSLVSNFDETLEGIQTSISNYKRRHQQILDEQKELITCRDDQQKLVQQFQEKSDRLVKLMSEDEQSYAKQIRKEEEKVNSLKQEEKQLMMEIQQVQDALLEEQHRNIQLMQQTNVITAVPDRKVVFKGQMGQVGDTPFEMKARIVYPMEGGTALVTFEDDIVAQNVVRLKNHTVELDGGCSIAVEAGPIRLVVPKLVEIDTEVCPKRVLISNLPVMDTQLLLYELEIHFSKSKNGGGEVEECEWIDDSGTVVITFLQNLASSLTHTEFHEVHLQKKKYRVRVTPFLNGKITNLKTEMTLCPRTVLLTGIHAIMEQDTLQDLLEIYFQKIRNGGGEIIKCLYNPLGQRTLALFESVSSDGTV